MLRRLTVMKRSFGVLRPSDICPASLSRVVFIEVTGQLETQNGISSVLSSLVFRMDTFRSPGDSSYSSQTHCASPISDVETRGQMKTPPETAMNRNHRACAECKGKKVRCQPSPGAPDCCNRYCTLRHTVPSSLASELTAALVPRADVPSWAVNVYYPYLSGGSVQLDVGPCCSHIVQS
jgi:hypothetical protein